MIEKIIKQELLNILQEQAIPEKEFNGSISSHQAWNIITQENFKNEVFLVDVRTNEERVFTGYVPDTIHVAWATGTAFTRNPRFIKEVETKTDKNAVVLLLCRSGNRSKQAAITLKKSGFIHIYNINNGFEGDLNEQNQRNSLNGWKFEQLPWIQS